MDLIGFCFFSVEGFLVTDDGFVFVKTGEATTPSFWAVVSADFDACSSSFSRKLMSLEK